MNRRTYKNSATNSQRIDIRHVAPLYRLTSSFRIRYFIFVIFPFLHLTLLSYLTFVLRTPLLRIGRSDSIDTRCIFLLLFRIATKHDVTYIIKGIPLYFLLRMPFFFFFFFNILAVTKRQPSVARRLIYPGNSDFLQTPSNFELQLNSRVRVA